MCWPNGESKGPPILVRLRESESIIYFALPTFRSWMLRWWITPVVHPIISRSPVDWNGFQPDKPATIRYNGKLNGMKRGREMGTERQGASRISDRLSAVARLIPPGRIVADIGSDHAQLLVHLAEHQVLDRGIAGEVNRGPYENAADRVRESGWSDRIDVRLGDGLKVLRPGEADVVVLAGMGGSLIASILSRGKEKLDATTQLVLQPNNHGD